MKKKILPLFVAITVLIAIIYNLLVYKDDVEYSWNNLTQTTAIETHSTNVVVVTERPSPIALTYGNGELILRELSEVVTVVLYPHEGKIDYYIKGKNRYLLIYTIPSFEKPLEGVQIEREKITMESGKSKGMVEVTFKKSPDRVKTGVMLVVFVWVILGSVGGYFIYGIIAYIYNRLTKKGVSTGE